MTAVMCTISIELKNKCVISRVVQLLVKLPNIITTIRTKNYNFSQTLIIEEKNID